MKKVLQHAPLVHTIVHLEISPCPALKLADTALEDAVVGRMIDLGFQDYARSEHRVFEVSGSREDGPTSFQSKVIPRKVFRSSSQMELIELSENAIILKTTDYSTFEELSKKYLDALRSLLDGVDQLNKVVLKRIGLRYVDVIAPSPEKKLEHYIDSDFLPANVKVDEGSKKLQGQMLSRIQTGDGTEMTVSFEELSSEGGSVKKVLPNNLGESDENCALRIKGQKWWTQMTTDTYGILDIDHVHFYKDTPEMDISLVEEKLNSLYRATSEVFWSSISDHAKEEWGMVEINREGNQ